MPPHGDTAAFTGTPRSTTGNVRNPCRAVAREAVRRRRRRPAAPPSAPRGHPRRVVPRRLQRRPGARRRRHGAAPAVAKRRTCRAVACAAVVSGAAGGTTCVSRAGADVSWLGMRAGSAVVAVRAERRPRSREATVAADPPVPAVCAPSAPPTRTRSATAVPGIAARTAVMTKPKNPASSVSSRCWEEVRPFTPTPVAIPES